MVKIIDNIESEGRLNQEKLMDFGADIFSPQRPFSLFSGCTTFHREDEVARILTSEFNSSRIFSHMR